MEWLKEHRSVDGDLVALVETDACGAYVVQVPQAALLAKGILFFTTTAKTFTPS